MRTNLRFRIIAASAAFLMAVPLAASAASYQYTIKVPYSLTNVPVGSTLQTTCELFSGGGGHGTVIVKATSVVATPQAPGPVQASLTVDLSASVKAGSYVCSLAVMQAGRIINYGSGPYDATPGWTGDSHVTGDFP